MNPFKDIIYKEKDGRVYTLHWKNRFGVLGGIAQTVLPFAGPALSLGGSLLGFGGNRQEVSGLEDQADVVLQQAEREREIYNMNAALKERQGQLELQQARREAKIFGEKGEQFKAGQRVAYAKSGVISSTGSPVGVMEDTAAKIASDRREILKQGFLMENFRLQEARNIRYQGESAYLRGSNIAEGLRGAAKGTSTAGLGSLLTSAGGMLPMFGSLFSGFGGGSLAGNQSAISSFGGLSAVANSSYVSKFMSPTW